MENGGGCITSGPFVNFTANLGPVLPLYTNVPKNPLQFGNGYNPRCLRRDIRAGYSSATTSDTNLTALIEKSSSYLGFQMLLEPGIHGGGPLYFQR